jgi:hypothetical protein
VKKILILVIVLLLIPCVGFADDGTMFDLNGLVTHSIEMDEYVCELGDTVDYTLKIKNRMPSKVSIYGLDSNQTNYEFLEEATLGCEIGAGQQAVFELYGDYMHPYYSWYPKEDGYYLDIFYDFGFEVGHWEDDNYAKYYSSPYNATTLKIENLNDGSDYIAISGIDEIGFVDFVEWELKYTEIKAPVYGEGTSTQTALITNISDKEIQLVTEAEDETVLVPLKAGQSIARDITASKKAAWDKPLRNSELMSFPVTFMMDDQYYGVYQQRVYQARYLPCDLPLKFDVTVFDGAYKSLDDDYAFYKIDIINKGKDIPEFKYILSADSISDEFYDEHDEWYEDDFYNHGVLNEGETLSVYARFVKNADIFGCFATDRYITNTWEYHELSGSSEKTEYDYLSFYHAPRIQPNQVEKVPVQEVSANIEQKQTPKQEKKIEPTPAPLEVVHVENESSMPIWVGILLGIALASTIAVIFILRKKQD